MYPGHPFYIISAKFDKIDVLTTKHEKVGEVVNVPVIIVHI